MSNQHSFTITKKNNKTEKAGISYLLSKDNRFIYPDKLMRKQILDILGIDKRFNRTFDLIFINSNNLVDEEIIINHPSEITLIELKATRKELPNNPSGFFFGATENEFNLANLLGNQYKFCFICLHPACPSYKLLTLKELEEVIKNKRIQYQINL